MYLLRKPRARSKEVEEVEFAVKNSIKRESRPLSRFHDGRYQPTSEPYARPAFMHASVMGMMFRFAMGISISIFLPLPLKLHGLLHSQSGQQPHRPSNKQSPRLDVQNLYRVHNQLSQPHRFAARYAPQSFPLSSQSAASARPAPKLCPPAVRYPQSLFAIMPIPIAASAFETHWLCRGAVVSAHSRS